MFYGVYKIVREPSMNCIFCAKRALRGGNSPIGRICTRCVSRIATIILLGDPLIETCWPISVFEQSADDSLNQVLELQSMDGDAEACGARDLNRGTDCLSNLRVAEGIVHLARALIAVQSGPTADAALAHLMGPHLNARGQETLRQRLFGT